jgi:hypothetical protein
MGAGHGSFPVSVFGREWYARADFPAIGAMPHMTQRNRKFIGVLLILGSIVAWLSIFTSIYLAFPPGLPIWILMPYFIVAGMGWLFPAMAIIRWMAKQDA